MSYNYNIIHQNTISHYFTGGKGNKSIMRSQKSLLKNELKITGRKESVGCWWRGLWSIENCSGSNHRLRRVWIRLKFDLINPWKVYGAIQNLLSYILVAMTTFEGNMIFSYTIMTLSSRAIRKRIAKLTTLMAKLCFIISVYKSDSC